MVSKGRRTTRDSVTYGDHDSDTEDDGDCSCCATGDEDCDEEVTITAPPSLESYAICAQESYSIEPREDLEIHYTLTGREWTAERLKAVKLVPVLRNTRAIYSTGKVFFDEDGEPIVSVRIRNRSKEKRGNVRAGKIIAMILEDSDKFVNQATPVAAKTSASLSFRGHSLPKFKAAIGPERRVNEEMGRNYPILIRDVSFKAMGDDAALETIVLENAVVQYRDDLLVSRIKTSSYDGTRFEAGYGLKDIQIGAPKQVYSRIQQAINTAAERLASNRISADGLEVEDGFCWFWASVGEEVPATIGAVAEPVESLVHWMKQRRSNVRGSVSLSVRLKAVLPNGKQKEPTWRVAFTLQRVAVESPQSTTTEPRMVRAPSEAGGLTESFVSLSLGGEFELVEDLQKLELASPR